MEEDLLLDSQLSHLVYSRLLISAVTLCSFVFCLCHFNPAAKNKESKETVKQPLEGVDFLLILKN